MTRHPHDTRTSSPAVQRARAREEARHEQAPSARVVRDATAPGGVRVDLDVDTELLEESGVDVRETVPVAWVSGLLDDGREPRWTGRADARVELHLEREAGFVRVTGKVHFVLNHPCVRCLNDVPFDVRQDIDLRLVHRAPGPVEADLSEGDGDGDDFEGAPLGDAADLEDVNIASYEGHVVKLGELLREQLFLELPMHPTCNSPRAKPAQPCGFDEKAANARESKTWADARWAGLAALRDKLPPGPGVQAQKPVPPREPAALRPGPAGAPKKTAPTRQPSSLTAPPTLVPQDARNGHSGGNGTAATPAPAARAPTAARGAKTTAVTSQSAKAGDEPAKNPANKPAEKPTSKAAKKTAQGAAKRPAKKAAQKAAKKPAKKAAQKAAKKPAKRAAQKAAKKPAKKAAQKAAKKPSKKGAKKPSMKAATKTAKKRG